MKRVHVILVGFVLCFFVFSSPSIAQKIDLKLMTGPMGGSWFPLGGAIGEAIQKEIPGLTIAVMPGAGIANVEAIELGKCEIAFSNSSSAADGLAGLPPFKAKMKNMRQMANLYPQYFQMVVLADSGIKSVASLKGKILTLDRVGNTGELLSRQVLQVYGLSYKDMTKVHHVSYSDSADLMKDGHADCFMLGTTIPGSAIIDLAADRKIALLSLPDDKVKAMQKLNVGYLKRVIPKGTYPGVDYEVAGVGYYTHLIVSAKLPDDLVYKMTKTFVQNLPRFADVVKDMKGVTAKDLTLDIGIPFHPGALKYFQEVGALK